MLSFEYDLKQLYIFVPDEVNRSYPAMVVVSVMPIDILF